MARHVKGPAGRLLGLATTLDSHRGFADVVASLREGHGDTIGGTWGSASALSVAALAQARATDAGTLVVVLPHASEADDFLDDLRLFSDVPAVPRKPDSDSRTTRRYSRHDRPSRTPTAGPPTPAP